MRGRPLRLAHVEGRDHKKAVLGVVRPEGDTGRSPFFLCLIVLNRIGEEVWMETLEMTQVNLDDAEVAGHETEVWRKVEERVRQRDDKHDSHADNEHWGEEGISNNVEDIAGD